MYVKQIEGKMTVNIEFSEHLGLSRLAHQTWGAGRSGLWGCSTDIERLHREGNSAVKGCGLFESARARVYISFEHRFPRPSKFRHRP
jgi:hypothetical protein